MVRSKLRLPYYDGRLLEDAKEERKSIRQQEKRDAIVPGTNGNQNVTMLPNVEGPRSRKGGCKKSGARGLNAYPRCISGCNGVFLSHISLVPARLMHSPHYGDAPSGVILPSGKHLHKLYSI